MYMGVGSDVTELLLCVWEVSTALTGPQTGYPDVALLWFSSRNSSQLLGQYLKLGHDCFHLEHLQFFIHL